jgi:hypothetical protein
VAASLIQFQLNLWNGLYSTREKLIVYGLM